MAAPPAPLTSVPYLQHDHEIRAVISAMSGSQAAVQFYTETVKPELGARNIHLSQDHEHVTTSASSISELTDAIILPRAVKGRKQTVLLLSGDGGMADIINAIHHGLEQSVFHCKYRGIPYEYVRPIICIIPMGTGNALAHSSGLGSPDTALSKVFTGTAKPLPTFRVRFSTGARLLTNEGQHHADISTQDSRPTLYGAVVCSWGLHASLVHMSDTAEYRQHGIERFQMAADKLGEEGHRYKGMVSVLTADERLQQVLAKPDTHGKTPKNGKSTATAGEHERENTARSSAVQDKKKENLLGETDAEVDRAAKWTSLIYEALPADADLHATDEGGDSDHAYVLATLVSHLQDGFTISPHGRPLDGKLHLVAFPPLPHEQLDRIFHRAFHGGGHVQMTEVFYEPVLGVRVDVNEDEAKWRVVCIDGLLVELEKGGWFEVKQMIGGEVVELVV